MSSIVLRDLLKHKVRKEIIKTFVKSMTWGQKIPFLLKYHKKKNVFLIVLGIITWNYSLHKTIYYWCLGMRPPHKILLGMLVDLPQIQATVIQLDNRKIRLSDQTKDVLTKLYYQTDKYLYFGLGRKYLFQVYKAIGMLQTEQQQKMFYQKSQFYKKRNQLAAGVGLVENLSIFEQALKKRKQKIPQTTQQSFRQQFIKKFIEMAPQIIRWQKQFNASRQKEYIKNAPGLTQVKKQIVSQILKQNPQITLNDIQDRLGKMGLRGLNISDKFYFYRCQQVYQQMKQLNIRKKLSHPTIHLNLQYKNQLEQQLQNIQKVKSQLSLLKEQNLKQYERMYEKELL